jgi:RNA polymerase sigma-70 factor (ECF subfamily)
MEQDFIQESDEDIVRQVQCGKVDFFNILIERYERKIKNYARKFFSDNEDINDVLQEIFIKAYRNIKSFDAERRFSPWLYRIAHNEFVNSLKKKNKNILPLFDLDVFFPQYVKEEKNISKEIDRKKTKEILVKFLDKLEIKYKEPIILYYFEEMSYKEIADVLQIPVATVGIRIKRAKEVLKLICQKEGVKYE